MSKRRTLVDIISSILASHPGGLTADDIIREMRKLTYVRGAHNCTYKTLPTSCELRATLASNPHKFKCNELKETKRTTKTFSVSVWRVVS